MSVHHDETQTVADDSMSGGLKILIPVLLLCLLSAGIFYLSKDNSDGGHGHEATTHEAHTDSSAAHATENHAAATDTTAHKDTSATAHVAPAKDTVPHVTNPTDTSKKHH